MIHFGEQMFRIFKHANIPEYFIFKKLMKGYLSFATNKKESVVASLGKDTYSIKRNTWENYTQNEKISLRKKTYTIERLTWAVSEAPAFKKEPYMTTSKNFLSAIEFELGGTIGFNSVYKDYTNTWEKINTFSPRFRFRFRWFLTA